MFKKKNFKCFKNVRLKKETNKEIECKKREKLYEQMPWSIPDFTSTRMHLLMREGTSFSFDTALNYPFFDY